jgi:sorting nexin-29
VWIPSVIKRGRGPDVHHAYQIYVKLKNEEWNVYRRFAEFYEFHKQLQRNLQEVNDFQFPPKKVINRKVSDDITMTS